jgi:hypothetical protein
MKSGVASIRMRVRLGRKGSEGFSGMNWSENDGVLCPMTYRYFLVRGW